MDFADLALQYAKEWGLLGVAVLAVGLLAWANRQALRAHEAKCDERYAAIEAKRETEAKQTRELISARSESIYSAIGAVDDKRERGKDEILRAISDRRIEEQGEAFTMAIGQLAVALREERRG